MDERQTLRTMVRGTYDLQKLRIHMGNRICANFRVKLGQEPGKAEEDELDEKAKSIIADLKERFRRITDGVTGITHKLVGKDEIISTYVELCLIDEYIAIEREESKNFRRLEKVLDGFPIWNQFLQPIRGIGPAMGAVIITEIDIHKSRYPSSIFCYAGLDVGPDGRGRGRYKEHLVDVEYEDKKGETQTKKSITYNPWLKTKLMGVLATSFLRSGSGYKTLYDDYKHRAENHIEHKEKTKGHRHAMAMRYMIKRFLCDLYRAWRPLEGLDVYPEYSEAKLGRKHSA